ncbi:MAG: hypothetical protein PHW14_05250 [Candidatus Omnitrophica bacterium]|nr:hypothetical protein [Candidatus Omnitrophota bacterium]
MSKMISLLAGVVVTLLGLVLLVAWWYEVVFVLRAIVPGILIFAGVIAVISGLSELKDKMKASLKK